jgi:hypothetical protein
MKKITMSVVVVLVTFSMVFAQQRFDSLQAKDFQAAFSGSREAFENLMQIIDEALASNPKNAMAKVTHGIGLLRRSGDAAQKSDFQASLKLFEAGISEMEQAVQLAPDNVAV